MKIKIVKCSKETFWYKNRIGEIFEVLLSHDDESYYVQREKNSDTRGYVLKEDTLILSEIEKYNTLTAIVEQLEYCNYITEDNNHFLKDNIAFIALKEMAKEEKIRLNNINLCCVCHINFVDSLDGFDTCPECLKRSIDG